VNKGSTEFISGSKLALNENIGSASSNSFLLPANLIKANGPNTLSTLTVLNQSNQSHGLHQVVGNSSFEKLTSSNHPNLATNAKNNRNGNNLADH